MKSLSLIVGVSAIAALALPMPTQFKLITSFTGCLVTAHLSYSERDKKRSDRILQERQATEQAYRALELENKQSAIEQDLTALANLRHELSLQQQQLATNCKATEELALLELATREKQTNASIHQSRKSAAIAIKKLKARYWQIRRSTMSALTDEFNAEIDETTALAMSALDKRNEQLYSKSKNLEIEFDEQAKAATAQIMVSFNDGQEAIIKARTAVDDDSNADLEGAEATLANIIKEQSKVSTDLISQGVSSAIANFVAVIEELELETSLLKEQVEELQGKLAKIAQPGWCMNKSSEHGRTSNRFLDYAFRKLGLVLNWRSSLFLMDGTLQLDFTLGDGEDETKSIGKLTKPATLMAIAIEFGCENPLITANPSDYCWRLTLPPYTGFKGDGNDGAFSISSATRTHFNVPLDFDGARAFMIDFVPSVPLPKPTTKVPTEQELVTLKWFFFWRKDATGQANIVSTTGLLREIYGVSELQGRAKDAELGESLCDRLERLMQLAKDDYLDLCGVN